VDRSIRDDYLLKDEEFELISNVSAKFHALNKPVVLLLNVGGPVHLTEVTDLVDAILVVWQCGSRSGEMIAEVLIGRQNPSGKLPMTFLRSIEDASAASFPGNEITDETGKFAWKCVYTEGIYVGYRYYDTFGITPLFPFGFGLSYTTFEIQAVVTIVENQTIRVEARVKNVGDYPGKETVQVYVAGPSEARIDLPEQELRGFAKTQLIGPGDEEVIGVEVSFAELASFDELQSSWVVLPGKYQVRVGNSSRSIVFRETFEIQQEITVKQCQNVLRPQEVIQPIPTIAARIASKTH
jgi:beta-glucosidase